MKHHDIEDRRRAGKRERLIRTAEWVLEQAYRSATPTEMRESQLRVRESVVREMRRRVRR
jgi:hypothetical protein